MGPGGYYHFVDYVRDLEHVARAVRRGRLVVVAHSMGGQAAGLWLGARPGAADGLLLVEALGSMRVPPEAYPKRLATWLDQTAPFEPGRWSRPMVDLEQAARRLTRLNPLLTAERALRLAAWATWPGPDGLVWRYDPLHRTTSPAPLPSEVSGHFWDRVGVPLGWIGGEASSWRGAALDAWLDTLPLTLRRILPGAGHMVQNDDPVALAMALMAFVGAV